MVAYAADPFRRLLGPTRRSCLLLTPLVLVLFLLGCGGEDPPKSTSEAPTEKQQDEIGELTGKIVAAYGGENNLEQVRSYRAQGVITAVVDQSVGETTRWFQSPDRLRIELRYPTRGEVRITRGDRGWAGRNDLTLVEAAEPFLGSMRLQTARMDTPLRALQNQESLVLMAADAKDRAVLRILLDDRLTLDYHVNAKNHRIERITLRMAPSNPPLTFEVDLSEFRWVNGVLFPFKEVTWTNGEKTAEVRIRDLQVNPEIPTELFGPPEL